MNFINLIELYGYDMFNNITLPSGVNKDILINTIMDKCALYIPLYTDLALLSAKITNFFLKNFTVFSRLYEACTIEYEMINNYDRTETFSKTENKSEKQTAKDIAKYSSSTAQNGTNTALVSPYDANAFTNDTQLQSTDQSSLSSNNQVDNTTNLNSDTTSGYNLRAYGNIGVTTSQQMLESELDIRPKLNIYEIIANFFYKEFVLFTY